MEGLIELLKNHLPINPVIIEAGGCDGSDTIVLAENWPQSNIFSFEPVEELHRKAVARLKPYPHVQCIPLALGKWDAMATMHIATRNGAIFGSNSLLEPKEHLLIHKEIEFNTTIAVQSTTLDTFCKNQSIDKIDLLYLDMQGAEMGMLQMSKSILSTVKVIYTEVSLLETYVDVPQYPEFKAFLLKQGFQVVKEDLPWIDMGNVLFVKNFNR